MIFRKKASSILEDTVSIRIPSQAYIIAEIIRGCHYDSYLELGVYNGTTYNYIKQYVRRAVGVDCEQKDFVPKECFFRMTTDDFFSTNKDKFDTIFIDACHEYQQVRTDFENSICRLNDGGVIFLHDTDPFSKEYMGPTFCNDSYKMNKYLEEQGKYQFVTIPMDECGLTLVRKKKDNRFEKVKQIIKK